MTRFISSLLLLFATTLFAAANYSVKTVEGTVLLLKHGKTITLTSGTQLDPSDFIQIENGAKLVVLNSSDSKLYTLTTPGIERLSRLIFEARQKSKSKVASVNSNLRFVREKDNGGVVFVEKGKVTRSMQAFDPEAADRQMDIDKLGEKLYVMLRDLPGDSCADNSDIPAMTQRIEPEGLAFMVENPTDHPIYFNVFKINGLDGTITISELGQPIGCYAILPTQFLAREQGTGINPGELHVMVMTDFYFDIDQLLGKLNALLDTKAEITAPENVKLLLMPL